MALRQASLAPLALGPTDLALLTFLEQQVGTILQIVLILALAVVSYRLLSRLIRGRLVARVRGRGVALERRALTISKLIDDILRYTILLFALYAVLEKIGIPLAPVLASVSILGIAVSFGAQSLVRDVLTGLFLLFEDQLNVGDYVELVGMAGVAGVVEEFGLRITKIRGINGELFVIPNGQIGAINRYPRGYITYIIDIPIPPGLDPDQVAPAALAQARALAASTHFFIEPPTLAEPAGEPGVWPTVRLVARVLPFTGWIVEKELVERLKALLGRLGAEAPVPSPLVFRQVAEIIEHRRLVVDERPIR
jgi:small conductance mechanosensitive channel